MTSSFRRVSAMQITGHFAWRTTLSAVPGTRVKQSGATAALAAYSGASDTWAAARTCWLEADQTREGP